VQTCALPIYQKYAIPGCHPCNLRENPVKLQRTEGCKNKKHGDQKTQISDPVHDKRLFCGAGIIPVLKPEPDKQVRTQSDSFPSDKHDQVVGSQYQEQHKEYKQVEKREKAPESGIMMHVTNRIHMDQKTDTGYNK